MADESPSKDAPACQRVFLTGYRGTGKTTVAGRLAEQLGWQAIDTDDMVEQATGKSIAEIFAELGEEAFRELEAEVVAIACRMQETVVALGGGAILRDASRQRIIDAGPVVWLRASPEVLAERIAGDQTTGDRRPALTNLGQLEEIRQVLADREPLYLACATLPLDTGDRSPEGLAGDILRWLQESSA